MTLNIIKEEKPWYSEGLNFKCTECGQCCTGAPGYIWVTEKEIQTIADHLKMSVSDFSAKYLRKIENRFSINERLVSYDCVFLKDKKCTIYSIRPKQCRTFPYWPRNLRSEKDWEEAAKYCEGIRDDAPIVPYSTIQKQLAMQEDTST